MITKPADRLNCDSSCRAEFLGSVPPTATNVQRTADKAFELLKADPQHPSLHFKKIGDLWSARVGLHHRALATGIPNGLLWFWIGTHADYDELVG